jgi:hypothetical protein
MKGYEKILAQTAIKLDASYLLASVCAVGLERERYQEQIISEFFYLRPGIRHDEIFNGKFVKIKYRRKKIYVVIIDVKHVHPDKRASVLKNLGYLCG